ncbi:hypothetical protein JYK00_00595 [Thermosipho ferrireducens]|uniref:Uncharacterized protein n=1 Tax=Thermosipho ferrireducens TaxID=2571116 RepID=A0ABX7S677_9BACT|nr:hypothetical protein [Thermosipho ferrireducens]QTA38082.1 hypothetical protein JYK00_00595 [Thermosipho ferrireducens]
MKRFWLIFVLLPVLIVLFAGCMNILNLTLPEGIYLAGDWNNWTPTENDKMTYKDNYYTFELPVASLTFEPGSSGNIGWYKLIYKDSSGSKISSGIPIWKENLGTATKVTIYASPILMRDGLAIGVGDTEKASGTWYIAGDFNDWAHEAMTFQAGKFVYTVEYYISESKDPIKYKIARGTNWLPYEEQFDGKNYNAREKQDGVFLPTVSGTVTLVFEYDPEFSILTVKSE